MDARRTASHFMGHQKVTTVVSDGENGAAQQFAIAVYTREPENQQTGHKRTDEEDTSNNSKPGGLAEVSWGEKRKLRADGTALLDNQETGEASASHFTGVNKATHVVSHDGNGDAPHFTRIHEQQRAEKHRVTAPTVYKTTGECTDSVWTGSGPHHLNWRKQVEINMSGTDNGAVHNFARTDSTKEPEALQEENEKPAKENDRSFMLITKSHTR
jgi:hypothetical protein